MYRISEFKRSEDQSRDYSISLNCYKTFKKHEDKIYAGADSKVKMQMLIIF